MTSTNFNSIVTKHYGIFMNSEMRNVAMYLLATDWIIERLEAGK